MDTCTGPFQLVILHKAFQNIDSGLYIESDFFFSDPKYLSGHKWQESWIFLVTFVSWIFVSAFGAKIFDYSIYKFNIDVRTSLAILGLVSFNSFHDSVFIKCPLLCHTNFEAASNRDFWFVRWAETKTSIAFLNDKFFSKWVLHSKSSSRTYI